ncbi:MAG: hypothetical protein C4528_04565 [Gammaproteobacteria bacterium]|nr:MAG: hypothetical protein C4528_04565 [Gammaproteobacteria bacterium]
MSMSQIKTGTTLRGAKGAVRAAWPLHSATRPSHFARGRKKSLTDPSGVHYTWDPQNRLSKVEQGNTPIAAYGYDPFNRRLWKDTGGTKTWYHYSDEGLIAEYNESGALIQTYGYAPDSVWGTDPLYLYLQANHSYYFYQNDRLGAPQKLTTMSGAQVWSASYDAYGEATLDAATLTNNLRYPGQYYDQETGLHYNWNRYYDPQSERYLSRDPIGLDGGLNTYVCLRQQ